MGEKNGSPDLLTKGTRKTFIDIFCRSHAFFYFFAIYRTPSIPLKSLSCVQSVALYWRAVAKMILSAIGIRYYWGIIGIIGIGIIGSIIGIRVTLIDYC
jgi:hypothetical protein